MFKIAGIESLNKWGIQKLQSVIEKALVYLCAESGSINADHFRLAVGKSLVYTPQEIAESMTQQDTDRLRNAFLQILGDRLRKVSL